MKPEGLPWQSFSRWSIYHLQTSLLVLEWCCYASYSVLFPFSLSHVIWESTWNHALCIEATVCPSPAPAAASPQNWRQKAAFTQRSRPGGGPGLLIPSPQPGLQEPQQCPHELCKASYSPMSPCWDTKVTCSMASRTASRRFLEWGCLRKACPICSGKTVCRNYTPAGEKPAVAMTEYGFIFIHLSKTNHHSMWKLWTLVTVSVILFRSEEVCIFSIVDASATGSVVCLFESWGKSY